MYRIKSVAVYSMQRTFCICSTVNSRPSVDNFLTASSFSVEAAPTEHLVVVVVVVAVAAAAAVPAAAVTAAVVVMKHL